MNDRKNADGPESGSREASAGRQATPDGKQKDQRYKNNEAHTSPQEAI